MNLFQLCWFTKPVTRDACQSGCVGEVVHGKITKIEKVLQYRTRTDEDSEFTIWMDISEDVYGEPPTGSY